MSAVDLTTAIVEKEREVQAAHLRIEALGARRVAAEKQSERFRDQLGEGFDGLPLPLLPLFGSLIGAVAANSAMFFAYVVFLTRFKESGWDAMLIFALVLGGASVPLASRPGAGGLARVGLRRFTIVGLALALIGVVLTLTLRKHY